MKTPEVTSRSPAAHAVLGSLSYLFLSFPSHTAASCLLPKGSRHLKQPNSHEWHQVPGTGVGRKVLPLKTIQAGTCHAWDIFQLSFLSQGYRSSHRRAIRTSRTQLFGCTPCEQPCSHLPRPIRILLLPVLWQGGVALALGLHETEAFHLIH